VKCMQGSETRIQAMFGNLRQQCLPWARRGREGWAQMGTGREDEDELIGSGEVRLFEMTIGKRITRQV
jgi:hypothetical protein